MVSSAGIWHQWPWCYANDATPPASLQQSFMIYSADGLFMICYCALHLETILSQTYLFLPPEDEEGKAGPRARKTMSVNVVHQALAHDDRDLGRGAVVSSAVKPIDWNTNSSFLSKWIWWWWVHLVGRRSKPFNTVRYRISPGVRSGSRHDELGYVLGCRYGSKHADEVHRWILVFAT